MSLIHIVLIIIQIKFYSLTHFQKAIKSKEKNIEIIKTWPKSQSLDETTNFETLAETLRKNM